MAKKPTVPDIYSHLVHDNPFGLRGATVKWLGGENHLHWRLEKDGRVLTLRMVNPESYRRHEWISPAEEYAILEALRGTGLGPEPVFLNARHEPTYLIYEYVEGATKLTDLKPLHAGHLRLAAEAIAQLNQRVISPARFPFMGKYIGVGYRGGAGSWYFRLADAVRRVPRRDVITWAARILRIVGRSSRFLAKQEQFLPREFTFHFDGAHGGNVHLWNGRVMFLDWEKVSWRNDPTFTLVRFATSLGEKGVVPYGAFTTLLDAYLAVRPVANFAALARIRLLERQTADLVWVLWDATRRRESRPIAEATSVVQRYAAVQSLQVTFIGG